MEGFELDRDQDVQIEAVGLHYQSQSRDFILGNTWILNSETREVVWELPPTEEEPKDERDIQKFNEKVSLSKGKYEVYYASFPYYQWIDDDWDRDYDWDDRWNRRRGWHGWMSRIFDGRWGDWYYDEFRDAFREFKAVVKGLGKKLSRDEIRKSQEAFRKKAVVAIPITRDDRYETQGFVVEKPMEVQIYALGEARRDGNFDYGLILNTNTLERVWQLTYRDSEHAGGAQKNRMSRESISLPAGTYVAYYISDDSHSPWEWNAPPPYDPEFWGLAILAKNPDMKKHVKKYDYDGYQIENAIVDFIRLRDDEFRSKGFTLKKPANLRVYAIGEGRDGDMFDYGWIVDAKTHERVWEMDYYKTEHAGGGRKNRIVDDVVKFEKGSYIAYFVTDGSHSYRRWNTSPPWDQEHWGMTIVPAEEDFDLDNVTDYEESEDENVLAKIVRVRDHDFERARFSLDNDSKVRIYAIGEGKPGRMYDYGWIEDAESGRVVWEMSYRKTDHAGGARKNRLYNQVISLEAGEYIVFYETDDSHSFNDWNASPPYDPINWGITVYRVVD
ncbi:hypothetical protein GWO43_10285 [candidate division KSB1 bacterium]|nr:hypothetical protein [candidate division KSB1 bacterium]NIR69685.1 hypothetical protein [candidate division KSB1 bacterium]NIS24335.1 hypothetical protein [candidate division KSB1 bacterium]NIT71263.1 hypothetical protein [candidate division KSB1 bacterium]NIU24969.1 hypothetical protein [candidate division KSB1 bacterium]